MRICTHLFIQPNERLSMKFHLAGSLNRVGAEAGAGLVGVAGAMARRLDCAVPERQ